MPRQVLSSTENLVTQWKSACTAVRGRCPTCGQVQRRAAPSAVAPNTRRSQVCAVNVGTGP